MKTKKPSASSLLAVLITVVIIIFGTFAIHFIKALLPDHKEDTVLMDMPSGSGLYFAPQSTDILLSYPWDGLSDSKELSADEAPDWIFDAYGIFSSVYTSADNTKEAVSYAFSEGIYYLNSSYSDDTDTLTESKRTDVAFADEARLISFNIGTSSTGSDSRSINQVYEAIGRSAYSNQSSDSKIIMPLDQLTAKKPVTLDEYVYNESTKEYEFIDTSSLSFFEKDPVSDFFRKYCRYCSEAGSSNKDAQYVYTLLRYGTYACIYSSGQIYLTYSITDFGTLTVVWNVESTELCAMVIDARNANPAQ